MTDELTFLRLLRDKVDLLIPKISINEPLIEISAMISGRIEEIEATQASRDSGAASHARSVKE